MNENFWWVFVEENASGTWEMVQAVIINNHTLKVANATQITYDLVKNKTTHTWKRVVAPVVKPPSKYLAKHVVRIGNHTI